MYIHFTNTLKHKNVFPRPISILVIIFYFCVFQFTSAKEGGLISIKDSGPCIGQHLGKLTFGGT